VQPATTAGLTPAKAFDTSWTYEYPDEETLARELLAVGGIEEAVRNSGENAVRTAIVEGLAPYRTPSGGYRLENEWHDLVSSA
jgi:hypothetical protein